MANSLVSSTWTSPPPFGEPPANTPPSSSSDTESVLGLMLETSRLVLRNWWIVALIMAAAVGLVLFRARKETPVYRATAVIRVVDKSTRLSGSLGDPGARTRDPSRDPLLTQIQLLQSRGVATEVVNRMGLRLREVEPRSLTGFLTNASVSPETPSGLIQLSFGASTVNAQFGSGQAQAAYGQPLSIAGVSFTISRRPDIASAQLRVVPVEAAAEQLIDQTQARPRERTDVIDVSYAAGDPVAAQRVTNTLVEVFQAMNARSEKQTSAHRREFIEQQLAKAEAQLSEAQLAHNNFRAKAQVYSSQDKFKTQQSDVAGIDVRRQELQADRTVLANTLQLLQAPGSDANASTDKLIAAIATPGVSSNPVIGTLYTQLAAVQHARDSLTVGRWASAPNNPDVRRLDTIRVGIERQLLSAVRGQLGAIDARIAALDDLRGRAQGQLSSLPKLEGEEAGLLAQVQTYQRESERLRDELQKAQIDEAAQDGQIDIVDLATIPGAPTTAGKAPRMVFAALLGLILGTILSYVRENYRVVVRRREDLDRLSQVPNLVVVPRLTAGKGKLLRKENGKTAFARNGNGAGTGAAALPAVSSTELISLIDSRSGGAEAYRTLRTNLLFSAAAHSFKRIVITSSRPSEGKSTTTANLAVAFAQQGYRVLVVDCDLRKPRIHKIFACPQSPGLTNIITGGAAHQQAIRSTGIENLSILCAGTLPPNPAELLASPRMRTELDEISANFDMVILDTPPVLVTSDAAVVGRYADGTVIVVRAGTTEVTAVQESIRQLAAVGTRLLGTVLNDPDAELEKYSSHYEYYYSNDSYTSEKAEV